MESKVLKDITDYIDLLREMGYSVTVSCFHPKLRRVMPVLLTYEIHLDSLCTYLKGRDDTRKYCISNKSRLAATDGSCSYYGCCWAGMEEYLLPISEGEERLCCVNISGYRGHIENAVSRARRLGARLGDGYRKAYKALSKNLPGIERMEKIAAPLKYMLRALYGECQTADREERSGADIYVAAIKYMNDHYMERITAEMLSRALNYSPSYLRCIFKKQGAGSITDHLTEIRLSRARGLLKYGSASVTEIALECGFCDGNYFSAVFKRRYGISPREYRQEK